VCVVCVCAGLDSHIVQSRDFSADASVDLRVWCIHVCCVCVCVCGFALCILCNLVIFLRGGCENVRGGCENV